MRARQIAFLVGIPTIWDGSIDSEQPVRQMDSNAYTLTSLKSWQLAVDSKENRTESKVRDCRKSASHSENGVL